MTSAIYPSGSLTHRAGAGGGGAGTGSSRAFATGYPGKANPRASMPFHAALQPLGEGVFPAPLAAVGAGGGHSGVSGKSGVPSLNLTKVAGGSGMLHAGGVVEPRTAPLQPLGGLTPMPPSVPRGSETDRTGYNGKPRAGLHVGGGAPNGGSTMRPRRPGADAQNGLTPLGAPMSSAAASALASAVASGSSASQIAPGVGPLPHFPPAAGRGVALPSLSSPLAPPLSDPVGQPVAASGGRRDSSGSLAGGAPGGGAAAMAPLQLADPLLAILEKQPVRLMPAGNQNPQPMPSASGASGESPNGEVGYTAGGGVGAAGANDRYATVNIHSAASTLRQDVKTDQQVLQGLLGKGGALGGKEDPLLAAARAKAAAQLAAAEAAETRDESLPTSPRNLTKRKSSVTSANGSTPTSGAAEAGSTAAAAGGGDAKAAGHRPKRASGSKSKSRSKSRSKGAGGGSGPLDAAEWLREMDDAKKTGSYRKSLPEHTHALVTFSAVLQPLATGLFAKDAHARVQILKFHKSRATVSDAMWRQITGTDGSAAASALGVQPKAYGEKITASGDDLYARVWESEVFVPDSTVNSGKALQPNFKPAVLAAATLCEYEPLRPLLVRVWNARDASHPEFWCEARTTWAQLSGALPTVQPAASADAKAADAKDAKAATGDEKATAETKALASASARTGVRLALTNNEHKHMGELVLSNWQQIAQRSVGAVFGKKKRTTDAHVHVRLRFDGHDVTSRGWSKDSPYVQVYLLIKAGDEEVLPQLAPTAAADQKLPTATRATKKGVEESWALVYTSSVCAQTEAPEWPAFHLPLAHLCCLSLIRAVRVVVRHAAAPGGQPQLTGTAPAGFGVVGADPVIGEATTSLKRLLGDTGAADDDDGGGGGGGDAKAAAPTAGDAKANEKKTPSKPAAPAAASAAGPPVLVLVNEVERAKKPKEYTPNGTLRVLECMLFYDGERAKNLPPPPAQGQVTPSAPTGPPPSNSRAKSKAAAAATKAAAGGGGGGFGDTSAEVSVSVKPAVAAHSKTNSIS